tara:strand:+ start:149 stop:1018 length:870 start_codon:yes stop_codon:yes gene_type:complete
MAIVGFIGLGVMGGPMAGHLAQGGYDVKVYNRTSAKATNWKKKYNGTTVNSPYDLAENCDFVFSCVGNDDDLRSVTLGAHGAFNNMKKGAVFIDCTTASADIARELSSVATKKGFSFLDAPVSGGQVGAETGQLTVMCGGDQTTFERSKHLLLCFAKACRLMGDSGAGQLTKMVNQICIAGLLQGLSEGLAFSEKAGLNSKAVLDVISKGAAGSWQMENRGNTMVDNKFDFGFAVDWMRKDLSICLNEANSNGASLAITAIIDQFYKEVQGLGGGKWDTSSLIARLKSN